MKITGVKVKPNARRSELLETEKAGAWIAHIKSPPVDGKASQELIGLVVKHFSCRKKDVCIREGGSGRLKRVQIDRD